VVQQPVEDGGGDDRVAQDIAPVAEALVGGQDDAAALVAGRDEGEERGGGEAVVGPDAELVDDQHPGREVDAQAAAELVVGLRPAEVRTYLRTVLRATPTVRAMPRMDRPSPLSS